MCWVAFKCAPLLSPSPQVWEMSNHNKQGFLDRLAFHKAMDIIALAQLVSRPPRTNGVRLPALRSSSDLLHPPRPRGRTRLDSAV